MDSICGIFNRDKQLVEEDILPQMLYALKVSESDYSIFTNKGYAGLGGIELQTELSLNHEEAFSLEDGKGRLIVAVSRIHNKEELFNKLNIPQNQGLLLSDYRIFLECFEKWKYDCPKYILGEWLFAIWDSAEQELFIASSHYIVPNFYYCNIGKTFYFSSSLKALLALDSIPKKINEDRLGRLMLKGSRFEFGETVYKGIHRLGPAHSIQISSNRFDMNRYWALEDTMSIQFKTDEEYVEAFGEIYTEAVKCRINTGVNIGSMLSGGLDSGSVTALAARELKKQGKTLQAFSSVPLFNIANCENLCVDETEFINATANYAGNIEVNFIKSENLSPLQALNKFMHMFDEPVGITPNIYWILSLVECAKAKGIDTLLCGKHGNMTVSWKGLFTGFMDWKTFLRCINKGNLTDLRNIAGAFNNHLVKPALPEELYKQLQKWQFKKTDWYEDSPINQVFAEKQNYAEYINELMVMPRNPRDLQLKVLNPHYGVLPFWSELGRHYNLRATDPTADKRVLEFCTSIPNNQFYRKGTKKYLFKRSMKGILPDKVIFNPRKGVQAADFQNRLMPDLPEIISILESFQKSDICNYYLDVKKIKSALPLIEQDKFDSTQHLWHVLFKGIAFGLFLQRFE